MTKKRREIGFLNPDQKELKNYLYKDFKIFKLAKKHLSMDSHKKVEHKIFLRTFSLSFSEENISSLKQNFFLIMEAEYSNKCSSEVLNNFFYASLYHLLDISYPSLFEQRKLLKKSLRVVQTEKNLIEKRLQELHTFFNTWF